MIGTMLDALTLDQMRVLVAIADHGSFRAAAIHLSRAQSSISHAIASIEDGLGIIIFNRSSRKPAFTREGEAVLADARAVLMKVSLMKARAHGMSSGAETELSIAIDAQFPQAIAARALARLGEAFPTLAVNLISTSLGGPLQAVAEGHCAMAIAGDSVALSGVTLEALIYVVRAAVVAPGHPLASAAQLHAALPLEQVTDHAQAVVGDPSSLTTGKNFHVLSPRIWRVNDNANKRALILAGACWGSLPLWMVEEDLAAGRLMRLPILEFGPRGETTIRLFLAHHSERPLGHAAARLRELLFEEVVMIDGVDQ
jgi:DNA-binding transcriptional LysR family regulator